MPLSSTQINKKLKIRYKKDNICRVSVWIPKPLRSKYLQNAADDREKHLKSLQAKRDFKDLI